MNPLPPSRPIELVDRRTRPPGVVPATLVRDFPAASLASVEASWHPARERGVEWAVSEGRAVYHWHWDWRNKVDHVLTGERRLVAIECEGEVQGLMAVKTEHPEGRLCPGKQVLYVDYLESAPWNSRELSPTPRFAPVGTLLIREAIRLSLHEGLGGRVSLHALENAETFYEGRCGMTRVGPDLAYHQLVYFEYTESQATNWSESLGLP